MFSLREFIKSGFLDAVGKMADYKIKLNAAGWFEKGVLEETDLAEIQEAIDAQYETEEEPEEETVGEETVEETEEETVEEPVETPEEETEEEPEV